MQNWMEKDITHILVNLQYPSPKNQEVQTGAEAKQVKTEQFTVLLKGTMFQGHTVCLKNWKQHVWQEYVIGWPTQWGGGWLLHGTWKSSINKADLYRNDELSVTEVRVGETHTCFKRMEEQLQVCSSQRQSLAVSTEENRLFKLEQLVSTIIHSMYKSRQISRSSRWREMKALWQTKLKLEKGVIWGSHA